jgi:hypothetical protein
VSSTIRIVFVLAIAAESDLGCAGVHAPLETASVKYLTWNMNPIGIGVLVQNLKEGKGIMGRIRRSGDPKLQVVWSPCMS